MNSRIRAFAIFLAVVFLVPALSMAGGTVPKGTAISVVTDQTVSSKTAKVGQPVTGSVAKDVTVGAGTAGAAATGKKDIEFPAETRLAFTTRTDVEIK